MKKKVILSAGGTGGHLFPAQNLAESLHTWDILFVAGGLAKNRFFDRSRFAHKEVSCATFSLKKPFQVALGCCKILEGISQSKKILREFSPDLVVGFGSFFTFPMLTAAAWENIPIVLHEQNAIPGKVNKLFSRIAHTTAITFPVTRSYLKGNANKKAIQVFFPQKKKEIGREGAAWDYFGLKPSSHPTLLVFGGSQGARKLNSLFLEALPYLPKMQILHFTGNGVATENARIRYKQMGINAYVKDFERDIDLAMSIADFALARAGAATICELIENELPALLVPYPHAAENHQERNGEHFSSIVGGGKMCCEKELKPKLLSDLLCELLSETEVAKKNIAHYKQQSQAMHMSTLIEDIL
jgi:UDP-N-acetylglucosamine--N-acetylmuramyl-(pentapeptide) pyrophosphoryl-undecaprenol N-acetylglucosamine transferase